MHAELFHKYLENCFKKLLDSYKSYVKDGKERDLFRFRVSIKKIRVCVACIEYFHGKRMNDLRHRLRKHFRKGGELRELELYRDWICRHHVKTLLKFIPLEEEIRKQHERFIEDPADTIEALEKIEKDLIEHETSISQKQVFEFYVELIITNLPLPIGHPPHSKWHALRKNLKRVRYARKWQDGEGLKLISKRQSDFLDLLQRYFGNWHDNEVMKQWMQRKAKQYKARGNSQLFKRAISIIEEDSKRFIEWSNQLLERAPMILQPLANRLARLKEKEQHSGKSSRLLRAT